MNVILTESVRGLGRPGEEATVKRGYAENYLFPQGLAVAATESNKKMWTDKKKKIMEQEATTRAEAQELADKLKSSKIVIAMKVGEGEKLYGSVTTKTLEDQIKEQLNLEIEKKNVILEHPIKTLGEHKVRVELFADIVGEVTVEITPIEE